MKTVLFLVLGLCVAGLQAAPTEAAQPVAPLPAAAGSAPLRLWAGDAPGLADNPGPEVAEAGGRVSNVSVPTLDVYLPPADKANGAAIIIVSGGGYGRLASGPLGRDAAKLFVPQGYAVFSLKYRLRPPSKNVLQDALADARRAVRLVRSRADEWHIDPKRISMVGFSAGANLILNLATTADAGEGKSSDPVQRFSCRPDFICLAALWQYNQKVAGLTIDGKVPPLFILHAKDDTTAKLAFTEGIIEAWKRAGVPVEFLPYEKGGHMAFNNFRPAPDNWPALFVAWMGKQKSSP